MPENSTNSFGTAQVIRIALVAAALSSAVTYFIVRHFIESSRDAEIKTLKAALTQSDEKRKAAEMELDNLDLMYKVLYKKVSRPSGTFATQARESRERAIGFLRGLYRDRRFVEEIRTIDSGIGFLMSARLPSERYEEVQAKMRTHWDKEVRPIFDEVFARSTSDFDSVEIYLTIYPKAGESHRVKIAEDLSRATSEDPQKRVDRHLIMRTLDYMAQVVPGEEKTRP